MRHSPDEYDADDKPVCAMNHIIKRYPGHAKFNQTKIFCDICSKHVKLSDPSGCVWHCNEKKPQHLCINVFYCNECVQADKVGAREDLEDDENTDPGQDHPIGNPDPNDLVFRFEHFTNFIPSGTQSELDKRAMYGVWWMKDNNMGWRFMPHKGNAQSFFNGLDVKNHEIGAKFMCMRDPVQPPQNPDEA